MGGYKASSANLSLMFHIYDYVWNTVEFTVLSLI